MIPFTFIRTATTDAAIKEGSLKASKYLAGGTNLIDLMKLDIEKPGRLVDINHLSLNKIEAGTNGSLLIGALVKNTALAYHPEILKRYPVISQAVLSGASAQLRNMASTGGNILQRTRCYYFYDTAFPCNKREPGSGCSAITGYNRNHALLGTSEACIATHPSDLCVAFIMMDATVHLQGPKGQRKVLFSEFHRLPGNTPQIENVLLPGELITAVEIPALHYSSRSHYLKLRDRASYEFALCSAAVALDIQGGKIVQAKIAMGGVGTKPWRAYAAEKVLMGSSVSDDRFRAAAEAALSEAKPHKYNGFKIDLSKRTLIRALTTTSEIA